LIIERFMPKLSLAIIALNEEVNLARTLSAAGGFADEVIVMDSGSIDRTCAVAESFGARVIHQPWLGYGAQKNKLFAECQGEWILSLDADEALTPELKAAIRQVISGPSEISGYILRRRMVYMGKVLRYASCDQVLRLVKKSANPIWDTSLVHEQLHITGKVAKLNPALLHYSYANFTEHFEVCIKYPRLSAQQKAQKGERFSLMKLLFRPPVAFFKSYIIKRGFLDGLPGFVLAMMWFLGTWMKYLYLWEITQKDE
jgi:glycosyltransferase involved in cell wall biosynthesis